MTKELILIRGLPGSGKSTLANKIKEWAHSHDCSDYVYGDELMNFSHFEADMYHIETLGSVGGRQITEYRWKPENVAKAHLWCQNSTKEVLRLGGSVIVSNTFSRVWEMQPYIQMAREFGAKLTVLTCEGNYGSVHDVPPEVVDKMRARWEKYEG